MTLGRARWEVERESWSQPMGRVLFYLFPGRASRAAFH